MSAAPGLTSAVSQHVPGAHRRRKRDVSRRPSIVEPCADLRHRTGTTVDPEMEHPP